MQHIVVTPFQSQWKEQYETEARAVRALLGEELIAIHHIGSTAVEGLAAKPIIDILAVVRNLENAEAYDSRFEELGYECMGEYGIPGRRYFRKGGEERTHQIHMFAESSREDICRHLAVRDYLRAHRSEADAYGKLKIELAKQFPYDIDGYCDGKDAFVKNLEKKALRWQRLKDIHDGLEFQKVGECIRLMEQAASWFSSKWGIPRQAYLDSMEEDAANPSGIPQWYVVRDTDGKIVAGAGIIANDFHDRKDLSPNLCALYVEEPWRNRGIARFLLDTAREEIGKMGLKQLYLVTDHTAFYERCGWEYLTMVKDEEGIPERMYTASAL